MDSPFIRNRANGLRPASLFSKQCTSQPLFPHARHQDIFLRHNNKVEAQKWKLMGKDMKTGKFLLNSGILLLKQQFSLKVITTIMPGLLEPSSLTYRMETPIMFWKYKKPGPERVSLSVPLILILNKHPCPISWILFQGLYNRWRITFTSRFKVNLGDPSIYDVNVLWWIANEGRSHKQKPR